MSEFSVTPVQYISHTSHLQILELEKKKWQTLILVLFNEWNLSATLTLVNMKNCYSGKNIGICITDQSLQTNRFQS